MDKFSDQNQQSQQQASAYLGQQASQAEETVEFKSASPDIPQNVEFKADHQLEEKIEDNLETER
jgi:hypothetical protein